MSVVPARRSREPAEEGLHVPGRAGTSFPEGSVSPKDREARPTAWGLGGELDPHGAVERR